MMTLPDELTRSFWLEIERFEEERKMTYVTSVERMAKEDGARDALQEMLLDFLRDRFGSVPGPLVERIRRVADAGVLRQLNRKAVSVPSLDEIGREIPT